MTVPNCIRTPGTSVGLSLIEKRRARPRRREPRTATRARSNGSGELTSSCRCRELLFVLGQVRPSRFFLQARAVRTPTLVFLCSRLYAQLVVLAKGYIGPKRVLLRPILRSPAHVLLLVLYEQAPPATCRWYATGQHLYTTLCSKSFTVAIAPPAAAVLPPSR